MALGSNDSLSWAGNVDGLLTTKAWAESFEEESTKTGENLPHFSVECAELTGSIFLRDGNLWRKAVLRI